MSPSLHVWYGPACASWKAFVCVGHRFSYAILVRDGKERKDRVVLLPDELIDHCRHTSRPAVLFKRDCTQIGTVYLPMTRPQNIRTRRRMDPAVRLRRRSSGHRSALRRPAPASP
jgi:hypothetical protein